MPSRPSRLPKAKKAVKTAQPSTTRPTRAGSSGGGWLRRHWGLGGMVLMLALAGIFWLAAGEPVSATAAGAVASTGAKDNFMGMPPRGPDDISLATGDSSKQQRRQELTRQLELLDHTLCSYRDATRYPNSSRPISEHPDQVYPNRPVSEQNAMRKEGGGTDPAVQIQTSQSRVFVAAGEAVVFTIRAIDKDGKNLGLQVNRTLARGLSFQGSRAAPQIALAMDDGGQNGDAAAGDGIYSGVLAPDRTGFASFNGTIRTELSYTVDGRPGSVLFDIIYSPEVPATWTGPIRESLEGGALNFYLKANVTTPGRYVVSGRVDDAKGKPFALVTFNDLLGQGSNEIRLTVVGKLLLDQQATLPLTLRDVDGYLLKENTDPDRALMQRIEGPAHVTKNYPLKSFSDAEWQSEERSRYLTEYGKDLDAAKAALVELDPAQARMPFPQSECSQSKKSY